MTKKFENMHFIKANMDVRLNAFHFIKQVSSKKYKLTNRDFSFLVEICK